MALSQCQNDCSQRCHPVRYAAVFTAHSDPGRAVAGAGACVLPAYEAWSGYQRLKICDGRVQRQQSMICIHESTLVQAMSSEKFALPPGEHCVHILMHGCSGLTIAVCKGGVGLGCTQSPECNAGQESSCQGCDAHAPLPKHASQQRRLGYLQHTGRSALWREGEGLQQQYVCNCLFTCR